MPDITRGESGSTGHEGGSGHEPFSVANLLKAQQRLLTGSPASAGASAASSLHPSGPVPDSHAPDGAQFGIQEYLDVITRRKLYVAAPLILVPLMAFIYSFMQPDEYEAESKLLLTRSLVGQGVVDDMSGSVYVTSAAIAQMAGFEVVRRRATRAIVSWASGSDTGLLPKLWSGPVIPGMEAPESRHSRNELTPSDGDLLRLEEKVFELVSRGVSPVPDTQNVSVALIARSNSRIVAAAAADSIAAAIVEEFGRLRAEQSSTSLIRQHMAANQLELEQVNRKIADLHHDAAMANEAIEGFPLDVERQYELLKSQQFELRSLDYMMEESKQLTNLLKERVDKLDAKGAPPPESLVQRLIDLEIERDQVSAKYTESHPRMQKLADDIEQTRKAIQQYPDRRRKLGIEGQPARSYIDPAVQLASEEAKLRSLQVRKDSLKTTAEAIRGEIQKSTSQERSLRYELLLTDKRVLQDAAVALRTRLQRAELTEGNRRDQHGGIVKPVPAETRAVGPHRWMTVILGIMMGSFAGVLLAFLAERLDETVRLPAEMRSLTGHPTLQVIPYFKRALTIRAEETVSEIANIFAVLRNNIRYSAPGSPERSTLITSATPGEGKSLIAVNLAISFAQEGNRTCLIDADIQKGERHALEEAVKLSWEPNAGLTSYLEQGAQYEHIVVPSMELPNLSFVASGGRAGNPPRELRSELAAAFFQSIQNDFDVIIVDAPPVLPVVDAAILADYCRSTLLIARYGYTRRHELEEAARRLRHVGAPVVGLVLNCARVDSHGSYYSRRYAPSGSAA